MYWPATLLRWRRWSYRRSGVEGLNYLISDIKRHHDRYNPFFGFDKQALYLATKGDRKRDALEDVPLVVMLQQPCSLVVALLRKSYVYFKKLVQNGTSTTLLLREFNLTNELHVSGRIFRGRNRPYEAPDRIRRRVGFDSTSQRENVPVPRVRHRVQVSQCLAHDESDSLDASGGRSGVKEAGMKRALFYSYHSAAPISKFSNNAPEA